MNESMKVLHCKFDTDQTKIYFDSKKLLIYWLIYSYKEHYPITVSPDMIWIFVSTRIFKIYGKIFWISTFYICQFSRPKRGTSKKIR